MLDHGIPAGFATLVAGGAGTGKTTIGLYFLMEGIRSGEPGVIVTFQETPSQLYAIGRGYGWDLEEAERKGMFKILYTSPVELQVDEHAALLRETIEEIGQRGLLSTP
jgi:circadian clock protein KaiC